MTLSENHYRVVKSIATLVEKKLEELENCLLRQSATPQKIRMLHKHDMNREQVRTIRSDLNRIYQLLNEFCLQYNIAKEELSVKKEILVKATFLWEILSDASIIKLKGYGAVHKDFEADYEKRINDMITVVNNIIKTCNINNII